MPRYELVIPQAQQLAFGRFAGRRAQNVLEDLLPHLWNVELAVEHEPAVDVHVLFEPLVHRRVGSELDGGRWLRAEHRAAAGCEADEVSAARDLPSRSHRVVAGRIHEHEARLIDRFGVLVNRLQRRRSPLHRRTKRLLENVREPARLIAWADDAVELSVLTARVLLPPGKAIEELATYLWCHRAAR